MVTNC